MMTDAPESNYGVLVTIGIMSGVDRAEIVIPMATDSTTLVPENLCFDAVEAIQDGSVLADLALCLSSDSYIMFVAAEGMMDGTVPYRTDYSPTNYPGQRSSGVQASNCGALAVFYANPADLGPGVAMRVGKNTIPGLASVDVVQDLLVDNLHTLVQTWADLFITGLESGGGGAGKKWYRVLAKASQTAVAELLKRVVTAVVRKYIATQRRRLTPH